jgi:hypothetical protein
MVHDQSPGRPSLTDSKWDIRKKKHKKSQEIMTLWASDRQEVCPFPSPIYPNLRFRSMRSKSKVCGAQNRTDPYKPPEIESLSIISLAILAAETIN